MVNLNYMPLLFPMSNDYIPISMMKTGPYVPH